MKNSLLNSITIIALVGLFTAGRVEAKPTHQALQSQHNTLGTEHAGQASQHTNLQNQHNAIQSQLEQIPPAWSQDLPVAERFVLVLGGAAVLDKETGLVWEQAPDGVNSRTWLDAQIHCNQKTVGNRKGWRLPTIQELASLVDPQQPHRESRPSPRPSL